MEKENLDKKKKATSKTKQNKSNENSVKKSVSSNKQEKNIKTDEKEKLVVENGDSAKMSKEEKVVEEPNEKIIKEPKKDIDPKIWKVLFFITLGLSGIFLILLIVLIVLLNTPPTNIF